MSKSYYYDDEDVQDNFDYQIEDLVKHTRLKAIEKELKSVGSMLDTRKLYRLADIKPRIDPLKNHVSNIRISSRRKGLTDTDLRADKESALNHLRNSGLSVPTLGDFHEEVTLYKTLCADPKYTMRRQYENPELHAFYENMSKEDKRIFRDKCIEAVISIAQSLRDQMAIEKSEMDRNGIFHALANEHRAHCLYLMKFYKSVNCKNIEDPILKEIRLSKGNDLTSDNNAYKITLPEKLRKRLHEPKHPTIKKVNSDINLKMKQAKSDITNEKIEQSKLITGFSDNIKTTQSNIELNSLVKNTRFQSSSEKIFQKLKRGRLGGANPAEILLEESKMFDLGRIQTEKRNYDSSTILDEQISLLISNELQDSEISKTSIGNNSFESLGSISPNDKIKKDIKLKLNDVMSYDDFHHMTIKINESAIKQKNISDESPHKFDIFLDRIQATTILKDNKEKQSFQNPKTSDNYKSKSALISTDDNYTSHNMQTHSKQFDNSGLSSNQVVEDYKSNNANSSIKMKFKDVRIKHNSKKKYIEIGKKSIKLIDMSLNKRKAIKGFYNHFKIVDLDSDEESEVSMGDQSSISSVPNEMRTSENLQNISIIESQFSLNDSKFSLPRIKDSTSPMSRRNRTVSEGQSDNIRSDKLQEIWNCLDISFIDRVDFMRKYSTLAYSSEFLKAVELWSEIAVYVRAREQLLKFNYKFKKGYCVPPIFSNVLKEPFENSINPIFFTTSQHLASPSSDIPSDFSLSKLAYDKVVVIFESLFNSNQGFADNDEQIKNILINGSNEIDELIKNSLDNIHAELDDNVKYGNILCIDWLNQTAIVS